jgi:hypothetical protein
MENAYNSNNCASRRCNGRVLTKFVKVCRAEFLIYVSSKCSHFVSWKQMMSHFVSVILLLVEFHFLGALILLIL